MYVSPSHSPSYSYSFSTAFLPHPHILPSASSCFLTPAFSSTTKSIVQKRKFSLILHPVSASSSLNSIPSSKDDKYNHNPHSISSSLQASSSSSSSSSPSSVPSPSPIASRLSDRVESQLASSPQVQYGLLSPVARKLLLGAIMVSSTALGYVGTSAATKQPMSASDPKLGQLVNVVGAGLGLTAGVTVGNVLRRGQKDAIRKKVATLIRSTPSKDGLKDKITAVMDQLAVNEDLFGQVMTEIYTLYLRELVAIPQTVAFHDIIELLTLKADLSMSGAQVGDAHLNAARLFYSEQRGYLDDPDSDFYASSNLMMDKLIFLSDRLFADKEPEEAYNYELARLGRVLFLSEEALRKRITDVAKHLFSQAIQQALVNPKLAKKSALIASETLVGISKRDAQILRADAYSDQLNQLINQKGKLTQDDQDWLQLIKDVLAVSDDKSESMLEDLGSPVYRTAVLDILKDIKDSKQGPEELAHLNITKLHAALVQKQTDLNLSDQIALNVQAGEFRRVVIELLEVPTRFLRVQNVNGAVDHLHNDTLPKLNCFIELIRASANGAEPVEILERYMNGGATLKYGASIPKQLYRVFLSSCLTKMKISDAEEEDLRRLRAVLDLNEDDAKDAFKAAAGPVYRRKLMDMMAKPPAELPEDQINTSIQQLRSSIAIPRDASLSIELDYYREVLAKAVYGNKIMSTQDALFLEKLRNSFGLDMDDVAHLHKLCCTPIYEQSIDEAMGLSGVIPPEYMAGLEKLRVRLGISDHDAKDILYTVAKGRMKYFVNKAYDKYKKSKGVRGADSEKDIGDDPTIKRAGAVLGIEAGSADYIGDLISLVDFYESNGLVIKRDEGEGDDKKSYLEFPVTLRGVIAPQIASELYRSYFIGGLAGKNTRERDRILDTVDKLAKILGMKADEEKTANAGLGTLICKNICNDALLANNQVGESELARMKTIQSVFQISDDDLAKIIKDAKLNRVTILLEQCFGRTKVTPEAVKKVRDVAKILDVDIVKNLQVSVDKRKMMFTAEIEEGIERGEITPENKDIITEAQLDLQLTQEQAADCLVKTITEKCSGYLVNAAASQRQGNSDTAGDEIEKLIRFGMLIPSKISSPLVTENEKQELFLIYQAKSLSEGTLSDEAKEKINLLKILFGFPDQQ